MNRLNLKGIKTGSPINATGNIASFDSHSYVRTYRVFITVANISVNLYYYFRFACAMI